MSNPAVPRPTLRPVDAAALARVRRRLAAAAPPWLHGEVARRMAERLPVIVHRPRTVIDWWQGSSGSVEVLRRAYPKADLRAVVPDDAATPVAAAAPWWSPRRWAGGAAAPTPVSALARGGAQLLWANMMLHWCADPLAEMRRWHAALATDGFLMFSTLGPGTLESLRALYAARGWPAPHAPFVDMHDLGDMLVAAGFADPVMDQETVTLHWADAEALLAELRALGANVAPSRHRGLRGRRWRDALLLALAQDLARSGDGSARPSLGFEIVYGHAFRPPPRPRVAAETAVGLQDMRAMLRTTREG